MTKKNLKKFKDKNVSPALSKKSPLKTISFGIEMTTQIFMLS